MEAPIPRRRPAAPRRRSGYGTAVLVGVLIFGAFCAVVWFGRDSIAGRAFAEALVLTYSILVLLLPVSQLAFVPAQAAARGYSGPAWFALTLLWLVVWCPAIFLWWSTGILIGMLFPVLVYFAIQSPLIGMAVMVGVALVAVLVFTIGFGPYVMLHAFTRPRQRSTRTARRPRRR